MPTDDRINYSNIGLMLLSTLAAFFLPFELFLFAYAILGPLHYLTEISWLHQRGYFTKTKQDYSLLLVMAAFLLLSTLGAPYIFPDQRFAREDLQAWGVAWIFIAFAGALIMVTVKSNPIRWAWIAAIVLITPLLKNLTIAKMIFTIFLPTLLHVFAFTGAFLLYGAVKNRSRSGIASFIVFCACPLFLAMTGGWNIERGLHSYVINSYNIFAPLNQTLIELFHLGDAKTAQGIFYSDYGRAVMRLIAFAYTYHYLNWFSKTEVIKWHEVSRKRLGIIGLLWLASIAVYVYNYRVGFIVLYGLSFLHVFLEFPLNHITFLNLGRELKKSLLPSHVPAVLPER